MIVKDLSKIYVYSTFYNAVSPCEVSLDEKVLHEMMMMMMMMIIIIIIIIIQRMWNVKTKVIPVIIGATGTISK
jgi:hypothetical protein